MLTQHRLRRFFEPSLMRSGRLLEELQNDFSELFQGVFANQDIRTWVSDTGLILELDAPGIDHEQVEVSVENDVLTISIPGPVTDAPEDRTVLLQERRAGARQQQFQLPFPVDASQTEASYAAGVLQVKLQRREVQKPAKIAVRAG